MADKSHNIKLPNGETISIPAWASESTLREVKKKFVTVLGNEEKLIDLLTKVDISAEDVSESVEEAADAMEKVGQSVDASSGSGSKVAKGISNAAEKMLSKLGDTDKPLTSILDMVGDLGGAIADGTKGMTSGAGKMGKIGEVLGDFIPGIEALGAAGMAVLGFNAAKIEQFAEAQQKMIDAGAIAFDDASTFNELYKRTADVGISYTTFVDTIGNFGSSMIALTGDISSGSDRFLSMFTEIADVADQFGDFGLSNNEMITALAEQVEIMRLTGIVNRDTQDQQNAVKNSFNNLMLEQSAFASLTGMNRAELLSGRNEILSQSKMAAALTRLNELGLTDQVDISEALATQFTLLKPHLDAAGVDTGNELQNAIADELFVTKDNIGEFDIRRRLPAGTVTAIENTMPGLLDKINQAYRTGEIEDQANFLVSAFVDMNTEVVAAATSVGSSAITEIQALQAASVLMQSSLSNIANMTQAEIQAEIDKAAENLANAGTSTVAMNTLAVGVRNLQDAFTVDLDTASTKVLALSETFADAAGDINKFFDQLGVMDVVSAENIAERMEAGENVSEQDQLQLYYFLADKNNQELIQDGGFWAALGYFNKGVNMLSKPLDHMMPLSVTGTDESNWFTGGMGNEELLRMYHEQRGGAPAGDRAVGGQVTAGQKYLTGERGPEYFVPSQNGTVLSNNASNNQSQSLSDGFSVNANVKLNQNIMAPQVQVNQQAMQNNNNSRLAELKSIRQARESSVQYLQELESVVKQMKSVSKRRRNQQSADV
jgi:hypothetical protein